MITYIRLNEVWQKEKSLITSTEILLLFQDNTESKENLILSKSEQMKIETKAVVYFSMIRVISIFPIQTKI